MKKLFLFLTVSILSLTFLSCSKDEEPSTTPTTTTPAEAVAGDYTGKLSVTINDIAPIESDNTISVEKVNDNTINLILKNFSITDPTSGVEISLGDIKLSNVALNGETEPYTFTAEETLSLDIFNTGSPMSIVVTAESGKFENKNLTTNLSINVMEGMNVKVQFEGTK